MKSKITKIASFAMALLVLFSTVSFTVEKHFCGDFLVDIAYFGNTNGCADSLVTDSCDTHKKTTKKNCCKNEVEKIEGQDNLKQETTKELTFQKQYFLLSFITSYSNLFINLNKHIVPHKYYYPPKLTNNIQILHQVFII